jgi:hypothetical protein
MRTQHRRTMLILALAVGLVALGTWALSAARQSAESPADAAAVMTVYMSPECPCCEVYVDYLRDNGYTVRVVYTRDLDAIQNRLGVPEAVRSCHTMTVAGYFVEGHVPVEAIQKLLRERPQLTGIALPGMPAGSPGMPGEKAGPFVILGVADGTVSVFTRL